MRIAVSAVLAIGIIALLLVAGCADVKATQKVGDFGTAFGATAEEQKAIDWFKATYGDPTTNNDQPARFVEPLVTTGISEKNLPVDKVTTFPVDGGSVYFFVIYDNFKKGDPITVSWVYLENGREVTSVKKEAGGDFGRFIVEFQKPDSGWGKGKQRITVSGDGATAGVDFTIGDSIETTLLPYNPGESQSASMEKTGSQRVIITTPTSLFDGKASRSEMRESNTVPQTPHCSLGATICDNKCVYLDNDMKNCGSCGNVCSDSVQNGRAHCSGGVCSVYLCDGRSGIKYQDCDKNVQNGCESDLSSDLKNCGSCGNVCLTGQECSLGTCCFHEQCPSKYNHY